MKPPCTAFVVSLASALIAAPGAAESWETVSERDGIVVEREHAQEGRLPKLRGTVSVDAGVLEILAVLQDSPHRVEWMARCLESRTLEEKDLLSGVYYNRLTAWPFDDRDVVIRTDTSIEPDASAALVRMTGVEWAEMGEVEDVVRLPSFEGHYRLTQLEPAPGPKTRIEYELALEMGGRIPGAIARRANENVPYVTLRNLRRYVPATRSDYADTVAHWREELPALLAERAAKAEISTTTDATQSE